METNIAMYELAQRLPADEWTRYESKFGALAARIAANLDGAAADLPADFLTAWRAFLDRYGYDGSEQMFVSSPRYFDTPEILLARLQHSAGESIKNPRWTPMAPLGLPCLHCSTQMFHSIPPSRLRNWKHRIHAQNAKIRDWQGWAQPPTQTATISASIPKEHTKVMGVRIGMSW